MAVDEAGVGLGFVAGRDLFVSELDQVVAAFFFEEAASGKKIAWRTVRR